MSFPARNRGNVFLGRFRRGFTFGAFFVGLLFLGLINRKYIFPPKAVEATLVALPVEEEAEEHALALVDLSDTHLEEVEEESTAISVGEEKYTQSRKKRRTSRKRKKGVKILTKEDSLAATWIAKFNLADNYQIKFREEDPEEGRFAINGTTHFSPDGTFQVNYQFEVNWPGQDGWMQIHKTEFKFLDEAGDVLIFLSSPHFLLDQSYRSTEPTDGFAVNLPMEVVSKIDQVVYHQSINDFKEIPKAFFDEVVAQKVAAGTDLAILLSRISVNDIQQYYNEQILSIHKRQEGRESLMGDLDVQRNRGEERGDNTPLYVLAANKKSATALEFDKEELYQENKKDELLLKQYQREMEVGITFLNWFHKYHLPHYKYPNNSLTNLKLDNASEIKYSMFKILRGS